jgi:transposase, IS5 family
LIQLFRKSLQKEFGGEDEVWQKVWMQKEAGDQTTFFDMAVAGRMSSNRVLETINTLVNFTEPERILEAGYSALGRPAHRVPVMLRIMILQHLYGLSDPQAEEQLRDRLSFQKFVGLSAQESVPDETAICRFRERLISCKLHERLLEMLNRQLEAAGYLLKRTTLVDATLIESSRKRPPREAAAEGKAPDADARYALKNGQSYYGYKAHMSTDGQHQLIYRTKVTPANVYDSLVFEELVNPHTRVAYADKAYDSKANKAWLAAHGIANGILKKGAHHIKLTADDHVRNARKTKRRRHIERVFAHLKKWQHYRRARYLGLVKNQLEFTLKAVAYNLKRFCALVAA